MCTLGQVLVATRSSACPCAWSLTGGGRNMCTRARLSLHQSMFIFGKFVDCMPRFVHGRFLGRHLLRVLVGLRVGGLPSALHVTLALFQLLMLLLLLLFKQLIIRFDLVPPPRPTPRAVRLLATTSSTSPLSSPLSTSATSPHRIISSAASPVIATIATTRGRSPGVAGCSCRLT